jgi:hypothetical protein
MKHRNDQSNTKYAIPNGEGFNALPVSFNDVVASGAKQSPVEEKRLGTGDLENWRI